MAGRNQPRPNRRNNPVRNNQQPFAPHGAGRRGTSQIEIYGRAPASNQMYVPVVRPQPTPAGGVTSDPALAATTGSGVGSSNAQGSSNSPSQDPSPTLPASASSSSPPPPATSPAAVATGCKLCQDPTHGKKNCPTRPCRKCRQLGHVSKDCVPCSRCHGTGHILSSCTTPEGKEVCFLCSDLGHWASDCKGTHMYARCKTCGGAGHGDSSNSSHDPKCGNPPPASSPAAVATGCKLCQDPNHGKKNCPTRPCKKCRELGHVSKDCPGVPCRRCHGTGHLLSSCTTPEGKEVCFLCSDLGHWARDCKGTHKYARCKTCGGAGHGDSSNSNHDPKCGNPPFIPTCTGCKKQGHRARDCPDRTSEYGGWMGFDLCHFCREPGHVLKDCPTLHSICR